MGPHRVDRDEHDCRDLFGREQLGEVAEQDRVARAVIDRLTREKLFSAPIVTEVTPATEFHVAEDYHQEYFERVGSRNPYCSYVIEPKVAKFRKHFVERLKR